MQTTFIIQVTLSPDLWTLILKAESHGLGFFFNRILRAKGGTEQEIN